MSALNPQSSILNPNIILGIDPGSRITGYGLIQADGSKLSYLASGCIKTIGDSIPERLKQISADLNQIIIEYKPGEASVEQVFMHANAGSALKLGQARGAAVTTIVQHDIPVAEYSAKQIKQAIVGYGAAAKSQMQHMVKTLLNLSAEPQEDAADALAAAICHAHTRETSKVTGVTSVKAGRWR
tara:strand:- start:72220 stop:72771 length:552 start_codon:yes stop_codon:yes gene_type:complete